MYLVFALLAGLFYTGSGLIGRHVLKDQKDAWAFSFYFSAVGAVVSLPFFIFNPKIPIRWEMWGLMFLVGVLIVLHNFLMFRGANFLPASIQGTVLKLRLVWILLFGIIILHESSSWEKIIGTIFTILAGLIVIHSFKVPNSFKGIIFTAASTLVYAISIVLFKYLFAVFNSESLTFFIFFFPMILNLLIMPNAFSRVTKIFKEDGKNVLLACACGGFANLAINYSLLIGEASKVLVISEAFLIVTLVAEHIWFKEKERTWIKVLAVIVAVAGAILITIS